MCADPITLGMMAVTAATTMYSAVQGQQVSKANARIATVNAENSKRAGRVREMQTSDKVRRELSRARLAVSRSGIRLDSPSAQDLGMEGARQGFLETEAVRIDADSRANAYTMQARMSEAEAGSALIGGTLAAGGQMLDRYGAWQRYDRLATGAP